jgi:hypothetical protein
MLHGKRSQPSEAVRGLAQRLREAPEPEDVPAVLCRSATEDLYFPGGHGCRGNTLQAPDTGHRGRTMGPHDAYEFPLVTADR